MAVRRLLARAHGLFPLTATGFVVLLASLVAFVPLGWWREDRVLLVAGLAGMALVGLGVCLSAAGAIWLWATVRRESPRSGTTELCVGHPGRTGFVVRTPLWLPLVDVRWTVHGPDTALTLIRRGREVIEELVPRRRGEPTHLERWFAVGDAFGLAGFAFPVAETPSLRFLPDDGALRQVEVVRGLASGDQIAHPEGRPEGDLQDLRGYGAGDPIRYVLWKVFAKNRELVVRSAERALSPVTRTAAYLIAGDGDEAAAGTAKTAVECGALGDHWTFGADHTSEIARDRGAAARMVVRSGHTPPQESGAGLEAFLAAPRAERPRRIVLFAPARPGPWVARVRAVAARMPVELILCADDIRQPSAGGRLASLVWEREQSGRPGDVIVDRDTLGALCRELAGVESLKVVDRRAGRVFASAHLGKLTGAA